jgi:hypothetical protein
MSRQIDDKNLLDWLEYHLEHLSHGRGTCSVDMGGNDVRGCFRLTNGKQFRVRHRSIRAALYEAIAQEAGK